MTSIAFRRSLKLTADALQLMRTGSTLEKSPVSCVRSGQA